MDRKAKQKVKRISRIKKKMSPMNNLTTVSFLVPGIALILVITLYLSLLKKAKSKVLFKRLTFTVLMLALLLSFVWEMLQMPLFKGMGLNIQSIIFCALAAVADTVMVLLLYFIFAVIYKDSFWVKRLTAQRIAILIVIGGIGAILAELRHLSAGTWNYSTSMPLLPFVNVGLVPVLQFMLLPVLTYYLSLNILKRYPYRNNV